MGKWISNFNTTSEFNAFQETSGYSEPHVTLIKDGTGVQFIPDPYNGHEYVDLGLTSGTLWATMNVGASSETDYGNYYQYGKGAAQYAATSGDSNYSGTEDPLAASADTAAQVWGGDWHMPTLEQVYELMENTTRTESGDCVVFTSTINGNQITLPIYNGDYNDLLIWINECSVDPSFFPSSAWMLVWGCEGAYVPYLNNETNRGVARCQVRGVLGAGPERDDEEDDN